MVKLLTVLLMIIIVPGSLLSQNLVPNPSFECGTDLCDSESEPIFFYNYACDWFCPTKGTSDIFSALVPKTCYSAVGESKSYHVGSQYPRTGNRYAGIYVYTANRESFSYREYLEAKLKEPLIPGEYYCAEMYVSASTRVDYACNNLAMYFSDNFISEPDKLDTLSYTPQIKATDVINDTINWVRVSGTFRATSPAKYLIIGNFSSDSQTDSIFKVNYFDNVYGVAYYLIDDISVEHLPQKDFIYTGDMEICKGEVTKLKIRGFDDVLWTTLEDTLTVLSTNDSVTVSPPVTTQYRVVVKNCNLTLKDTVNVTVDTFLKVKLGPDTTICAGSSITLNAGVLLGSVYQWQDGSSDQYLTVDKAGKYSVNVSNPFNDCVGQDSIRISILNPPKFDLGRDTIVCQKFFPLKAGNNYSSYRWSSGSIDSVFTPKEPGKYWVTVENRCGQASDSIAIFSSKSIFVPNVVTLNDDSLNSDFRVAVVDNNQKLNLTIPIEGKLQVYNRWGKEIFSDNAYQSGWPSRTTEIDQGVYYLTFKYGDCPTVKSWIHILK